MGPQPVFRVPPGIVAFLAVLVLVHAVRLALPAEDDVWAVLALTFNPARYSGYGDLLPGGAVAGVTSFLSYAFLHASLSHLFFNSVWILAFGSVIMRRLGPARFALFSAVCAVAGAALFLVSQWGAFAPMAGASGIVSGLLAATLRLLPGIERREDFRLLREAPERIPLVPLGEALRDPRLLLVSAVWLWLNVLAGAGIPPSNVTVAWEAHIGGYAAGFFLFDVMQRPFQPAPAEAPPGLPGAGSSEEPSGKFPEPQPDAMVPGTPGGPAEALPGEPAETGRQGTVPRPPSEA